MEELKTLRNIGSVVAQKLYDAGIDSPAKLRELGAKEAFVQFSLHHKMFCFNAVYLYAFQGAIDDVDWRAIPQDQKEDFKTFTKSLREDFVK